MLIDPSKPSIIILSPRSPKPRTNHNDIEKQYRDRLNDRFEDLLDVLHIHETSGKGKLSKGHVLVLARDRIEELEREGEMLEGEGKMLMQMLDSWVRKGAGVGVGIGFENSNVL